MKTIIKEIRIYKYDELDLNGKYKAKKLFFHNEEVKYFTRSVIEDLENKWNILGLRPYYHLGSDLNRGLCLLGHIYFRGISKKLKEIFYQDFNISDYRVIKEFMEYSLVEFKHCGNCYNGYSVDIDIYNSGCQNSKLDNTCEKTVHKLIKNIKGWHTIQCYKYEQKLDEFFYESDEDELKEYFNEKNYIFLEDGTIFSQGIKIHNKRTKDHEKLNFDQYSTKPPMHSNKY